MIQASNMTNDKASAFPLPTNYDETLSDFIKDNESINYTSLCESEKGSIADSASTSSEEEIRKERRHSTGEITEHSMVATLSDSDQYDKQQLQKKHKMHPLTSPVRAGGPKYPEKDVFGADNADKKLQQILDLAKMGGLEEVLAQLKSFDKEKLNFFVENAQLQELFASAYRRRMVDKVAYRYKELSLLRHLTVDRINDLEAPAIACIIRSLQRAGIRDVDQAAVQRLICSQTDGDRLSLLKERLDPRGCFHSFHRLVFSDIVDRRVRQAVLEHIQKRLPSSQRGTKIISDIDDTLICSGGSEVFKGTWAGVDRRLPPGTIYPGILQLMKELDLGVSVDGHWPRSRLGNLVFLSARPHLYADWTERLSFQLFDRLVSRRKMHAQPAFLSGDLSSVSAVWNNMVPMAMKKLANFQQFTALYPEYDYIFIGDNGQADVHVAEMIEKWCREQNRPMGKPLTACFIQQVQPRSLTYRGPTLKYEGTKTEDEWRSKGIYFFRTYIGCATIAASLGLIHVNAVGRVGRKALEDFEEIKFSGDVQREAYSLELNEDILAANALMRAMGAEERQLQLVPKGEFYAM